MGIRDEIKKEKFIDVLTYGYCEGVHCEKHTPAVTDHICPYAEDVYNDPTAMCNCCDLCTFECAQDI